MSFPFSRTFGAGNHKLTTTDLNVLCDTSVGVVNLVLPKISDVLFLRSRQGYPVGANGVFTINITDISNNASTNNIIVTTQGGDYFSGNVSVSITDNSGNVSLKPVADNFWQVVYGNGVTGGGANNAVILLGAGTGSSYRCGNSNDAKSTYGTVSGGATNIDNGGAGHTISGGVANTISGTNHNTISGGYFNTSSGYYQSTIGGGYSNTSSTNYATISGGACNIASCFGATISGGSCNTASAQYTTISGGRNNKSLSNCSIVGGGFSNSSGILGNLDKFNGVSLVSYTGSVGNGVYSVSQSATSGVGVGASFFITISGGSITGIVIDAGGSGFALADTITIQGTQFPAGTSPADDVVLSVNALTTNAYNTISGGHNNTASCYYSTISGGYCNISTGWGSVIGGGVYNTNSGYYSTISGGYGNTIATNIGVNSCHNTISGGVCNSLTNTFSSSIVGGDSNTICDSGCRSFIGGGLNNIIRGAGCASVLVGGSANQLSERFTFMGGGLSNTTNSSYSTLVGGKSNTVSGAIGVVVGGASNQVLQVGGFIGGGFQNTASGTYTAVLGGRNNTTSAYNFAMIVGDSITADRACTTFVNALSMKTAPTQANLPLPAGTVYVDTTDGNRLKMA